TPDARTACPPNYTTATTINRGSVQGQCNSGCSCAPPQVNCVTEIFDYASYAECMTDQAGTRRSVQPYSLGLSCLRPNWNTATSVGPVLVVAIGDTPPSFPGCPPPGTPTPGPPTWTTTANFCATTQKGGGCGTGSVCVPAINNNTQRCLLTESNVSCPAGTTR